MTHLRATAFFLAALTGGAASAAETVTISTADCRQLVAHVPDAGVNYEPGVDVHGKPVVPADLNGAGVMDLPAIIEIPLTVDVIRRLRGNERGAEQSSDILSPRRGLEGKASLGTLTIKGNDAFWNGKPLQTTDEAMLAEACRSSLQARGIILPQAKPDVPE